MGQGPLSPVADALEGAAERLAEASGPGEADGLAASDGFAEADGLGESDGLAA
ncbi:hypothetical protein GTY23_23430, partial [Streptomyces sp. SID5998]|nr:hypothetical protein [Streptomyces sp. SID5998]